jgi:hypothetical protein
MLRQRPPLPTIALGCAHALVPRPSHCGPMRISWNRCLNSSGGQRRCGAMPESSRVVALLTVALGLGQASFAMGQGVPANAGPALRADSAGVVTVRTRPDTVTVGEPFTLQLRAVPPGGRVARPPAVPDTGGIIEPLDPALVTRRGDTVFVRYRLIAWQPGVLTIPLGPVIMRRGESDLSVAVDARIVVRSVLPPDSADRNPKVPRALFASSRPWWAQWWLWALGTALLMTLMVMLRQMWRARRERPRLAAQTPLQRAERALARLDARQLAVAGEGGRQIALSGEIVRRFLSEIEPSLALSMTSAEVLRAAEAFIGIPHGRLAKFLAEVDSVRFGGRPASRAMADGVTGLARELVRETSRVRGDGLRAAA